MRSKRSRPLIPFLIVVIVVVTVATTVVGCRQGGLPVESIEASVATAEPADDWTVVRRSRFDVRPIHDAIEVALANIVNAETTGYKRTRTRFVSAGDSADLVRERDHAQGELVPTERPLDIAIDGEGFLQARDGSGNLLYTRSGALHIDPNGQLITADGYPIEPAITLPDSATDVTILPDGIVRVSVPDSTTETEVGQLTLARFMVPEQLDTVCRGRYFAETPTSGTPTASAPGLEGLGTLVQGHLEHSNVRVADERARIDRLREWAAALRDARR